MTYQNDANHGRQENQTGLHPYDRSGGAAQGTRNGTPGAGAFLPGPRPMDPGGCKNAEIQTVQGRNLKLEPGKQKRAKLLASPVLFLHSLPMIFPGGAAPEPPKYFYRKQKTKGDPISVAFSLDTESFVFLQYMYLVSSLPVRMKYIGKF